MEIILLILLLVVFIGLPLLSMRKQSQRMKEIKAFQDSLDAGMVVKMTSGVHGRVTHVGAHTIDLEISDGMVTTWDKSAVLERVETTADSSEQSSEQSEQPAVVEPLDEPYPGHAETTRVEGDNVSIAGEDKQQN
ncbi:preprotein translocase subunit YajC [Corynebacterium anserum]|uniref:Preprotein translocase subunit YajC n=1 Tax=Corynebacterium anserum TaxID=2684406 RepID=A0A7G7YNK4_9CORY|nr:preprotein translocase subunit YajC [Corynebacterium anserum]MBC2681648.1 preprotein translocase subunit YajC [Corynebacterium anserum]QNH96074.1 preprotein translocase subunit YajC [Corynebacterium anserum]